MIHTIHAATPFGVDARIIDIEIAYHPGLPAMHIVGMPDTAIRESRDRIWGCLRSDKRIRYPIGRIVINLAPASFPKFGTQFDLGIAVGIASISEGSEKRNAIFHDTVFLGELSLDGRVRPVYGCLAMVIAAQKAGYARAMVAREDFAIARLVPDIDVIAVDSFNKCVDFCNGTAEIMAEDMHHELVSPDRNDATTVRLEDIQGLRFAKRALEIAAAGGHNLLLSGSPGLGKTMLAKALPSILPDLDVQQRLQTMAIHGMRSISEFVNAPPFRAPLPGITHSAFVGGGYPLRPGEMTLAHNGVLFMDELPEFSRTIIEALREPLESGSLSIAKSREQVLFPARFLFIAAHNLCPCGNYGDTHKVCTCSAYMLQRYQKKISGPIMDRVDLHVQLQHSDIRDELVGLEEHEQAQYYVSMRVLQRVKKAREMQYARNTHRMLNGWMAMNSVSSETISCSAEAQALLQEAQEKFSLSMRRSMKVLRVARTIADLADSNAISGDHVVEALRYRSL